SLLSCKKAGPSIKKPKFSTVPSTQLRTWLFTGTVIDPVGDGPSGRSPVTRSPGVSRLIDPSLATKRLAAQEALDVVVEFDRTSYLSVAEIISFPLIAIRSKRRNPRASQLCHLQQSLRPISVQSYAYTKPTRTLPDGG